MEKTKKNGFLKTAACIFGGTMLMTCVLGGTLAKYATTTNATQSEVKAAKWDIEVGGAPADSAYSIDSLTIAKYGSYDGTVPAGKACPGTWGYAVIPVVNNSDVDAAIKLTGTATQEADGIKYFLGTDEDGTISAAGDLDTLQGFQQGRVLLEKEGGTTNLVVGYTWDYGNIENDSGHDTADTDKGKNQTELSFTGIQIEVVQNDGSAQ